MLHSAPQLLRYNARAYESPENVPFIWSTTALTRRSQKWAEAAVGITAQSGGGRVDAGPNTLRCCLGVADGFVGMGGCIELCVNCFWKCQLQRRDNPQSPSIGPSHHPESVLTCRRDSSSATSTMLAVLSMHERPGSQVFHRLKGAC
ncbi:hypothetical protein C369_07377 [Cryptococcus neoformans A5-35-17]|nr:hypothetical protein C369_07377 [Cryptococcus neoformans var. grubii A5-35-17]